MGNTVSKVFTANANWTAPAEVFFVRVITQQTYLPFATYGTSAAMIATDNTVYAWGLNANGELGVGDVTLRSSPVAVLNSYILDFMQVPSGRDTIQGDAFMVAVNSAGDAYSYGGNTNGQLGLGDVAARSSPVAVLGGLKFSSIYIPSNESNYVLGLTPTGAAYAWGVNAQGQLGVGDVLPRSSPVAVLGGLTFQQLIGGNDSTPASTTVGLTAAGAAYAWGVNAFGQLGVGDVLPRSSPVAVLGGLTFAQLFVDHSASGTGVSVYGLTAAGQLYAWGNNSFGQLGVGDIVPRSSPVLVLGGLTWKSISVSYRNVTGVTTAGVAYSWGANSFTERIANATTGQLGVGDSLPRSSPVAVVGGLTFASVQQNVNSAFGLTASGVAYSWGSGGAGLGQGALAGPVSSPVAILGGLTFQNIYANSEEQATYGITTLGQVYSWGFNISGQLGQGPVAGSSSPVLVLGGHFVSPQSVQVIKELTVVPGTTYAINITNPICFFGTTPIGPMVTQLSLQYQQ